MGGAGWAGRGEGPTVPPGRATFALRRCGTALGSGGMARGLLPLLLVAVLIIETQCKNDTEALMTYNRRIIARREVKCTGDEYNLDAQCCKKCNSGSVKNVTCPTDINKHCVPCEKGKEFIDHPNDSEKCQRCKSCDSKLGEEVVKNCTPTEDTKCACAKNYFCAKNKDAPSCSVCKACTICESGVIEKQCNPTSDTVCGTKGMPSWAIAVVVVLLIVAIAGAIFCWKKKHKSLKTEENSSEVIYPPEPRYEKVPLLDIDADLSSHIPGMAAVMTLAEVKMFVRHHHVPEPDIDQIIQDFPGDTSEQKIRLFRVWYQRHGLRGAYATLISSLRELKMCAAADRIEKKLKAAIFGSQEGGQACNGDTEQNKTCTQEGRNTHNDNAELSKTDTGSLEET